jgi:hypothetical protein
MLESANRTFSSAAVSAFAANAMLLFHVEPPPTGEFRVYADTFLIEDFRTEIEAKALCNRLIVSNPAMHARARIH